MDDARGVLLQQSAERLSARFPPALVRRRILWRLVGLPAVGMAIAGALSLASRGGGHEDFPLPSVGFYLLAISGLLPAGGEASRAVLAGCGLVIFAIYAAIDHQGSIWIIGHVAGFAALVVVFSIRFRRRARRHREIRG
jgi:hypothetical protein